MSFERKKIAYLGCPYADPDPNIRKFRLQAVTHMAFELRQQGRYVYSPLTHNIPIDQLGVLGDFISWLEFDHNMLSRCDTLLVLKLPGWQNSKGLAAEIAFAKRNNIPIEEIEPTTAFIEKILSLENNACDSAQARENTLNQINSQNAHSGSVNIANSDRFKTHLNIYLILEYQGKILLSLRKNTGFEDGRYGLVSGHVEADESAMQAACREAFEEVGILIESKDLKVILVVHSKTNRENIDIYMRCHKWRNEIVNKEPDKCEELKFFDTNQLPSNMMINIPEALTKIATGEKYAEFGWISVKEEIVL